MRLSKEGRARKGIVAPMSDDDDSNAGTANLHQSITYTPRQDSRGVSFSTSRGKIWLILIINLSIVTIFIFMSSSRFPSLYGDGVVNDALEQDQQHPGPVSKNAEQALSLTVAGLAVTGKPRVPKKSQPRGYTKLTSTEHPEASGEQLETEAPLSVPSDEVPTALADDQKEESEQPLPSVTQEPVSDVNAETDAVTTSTNDDILLESVSDEPDSGQRSPAEIADLISRMKESQVPSSETLAPSPEQPDAAEYMSTSAVPQSVELESSAVKSKAFSDNLSLWLKSDSGVEVENLAACLTSSGENLAACGVNRWINQIPSSDSNAADSGAFRPALLQQKPVWIPIAPDTHNQLPTVYFSCPLVTDSLKVHESMTLLFVLSPAQIETGDSYTGQKFFGNTPYGQFALLGGKPSFFANNGLVESSQELPTGQFSLLTYRLHEGYVEIKANGGFWGGESPVEGGADGRRVRVTVNDVVSLGNSKGACDTNAFQGRIAEILVYDAVLDDVRLEAVEKYLHDKWWGDKTFPAPATVEDEVHHEWAVDETDPATERVSVAPANEPRLAETTQEASTTDKPLAVETQQDSTSEKSLADSGGNGIPQEMSATEAEDATPAPKFDPRVNIFEWTPSSDVDPAKAARWASTVKEMVDYIRNFQIGGDVLRTLIHQHKDELVVLREELFG